MAVRYDIGSQTDPVWSGTAVSITWTLTPTQNTAGWTTLVTFKRTASDNSAIKTYSPGGSNNGVWTITMTRADTLLFAQPGTYVYSLERVDTGQEAVLTYGNFQVDRKVNS